MKNYPRNCLDILRKTTKKTLVQILSVSTEILDRVHPKSAFQLNSTEGGVNERRMCESPVYYT